MIITKINLMTNYTKVKEVLTMPYRNKLGLWKVDVTYGDLNTFTSLTFNTREQAIQVKINYIFAL